MNTSVRMPPFSEEAEVGVLGSFIAAPIETATHCNEYGISKEHFYIPAHRLIFQALQALCEKAGSDRIDMLSLSMELKDSGNMDKIGGEALLSKIFDAATAAHANYYIEQIKQKWLLRNIIQNSRLQESRAYEADMEPEDLLAEVVSDAIALTASAKTAVQPSVIHAQNIAICDRAKETGSAGYRSRFDEFENILGSYIAPELIVVAARPSDGKTTFATNEVDFAAEVHGVPCGIVSIEMCESSLRSRMAGEMAEVSTFRGLRGQWTPDDRAKMIEAYARLEKLPIYINDEIKTFSQVQSWCINVHARYGVRLFVVDYIQLMKETGADRYRTRNEFVASLSSGFKWLAKRLDSVFMVLSQENRGGHREKTKTPPLPTLESLRDSGGLEQDADKVVLLSKEPHLDIATNFRLDQDWPMIADLAKSRNGPTGDVRLHFLRSAQKFAGEQEYRRICEARAPVFND